MLPDSVFNPVNEVPIFEAIVKVQNMAGRDDSNFRSPWPAGLVMFAPPHFEMADGSVLAEHWHPLSAGYVDGTVDAV